jgi:hypothetical protein
MTPVEAARAWLAVARVSDYLRLPTLHVQQAEPKLGRTE